MVKRYNYLRDKLLGGQTDIEARKIIVNELISTWESLGKVTCSKINIATKRLPKLLKDYKDACANISQPHLIPVDCFVNRLSETFDIETKVDPTDREASHAKAERERKLEDRRNKEEVRKFNERTIYNYDDSIFNFSEDQLISEDEALNLVTNAVDDDDLDFVCSVRECAKKKIDLISTNVVATSLRGFISPRFMSSLLADMAASLNYDLSNCVLSYSTIARYRKKHQIECELKTKERIDNCRIRYKTLHFDGIRLFVNESSRYEEHLAIGISCGKNYEELINIVNVKVGDSNTIFEAIKCELDKLANLVYQISAVSHDTPAVNTGVHGGVVVRLIRHFQS